MNWETVNPQWWVQKGYGAVRVDGRGSGKSPGECEPWPLSKQERWALREVMTNPEIGAWRATLDGVNRRKLNHPNKVIERWRRATQVSDTHRAEAAVALAVASAQGEEQRHRATRGAER